jgi:hypothetical protein
VRIRVEQVAVLVLNLDDGNKRSGLLELSRTHESRFIQGHSAVIVPVPFPADAAPQQDEGNSQTECGKHTDQNQSGLTESGRSSETGVGAGRISQRSGWQRCWKTHRRWRWPSQADHTGLPEYVSY